MSATVAGIIITMGVQIASSIFNQKFSKKNTDEIKRLQQDYKRESQQVGQTRDWEKFQRSCSLTMEIENNAHIERIQNIERSFENSFRADAYEQSLSRYSLNINPYFIKNGVISFNRPEQKIVRKELFCVLTNSNKENFNKDVFPVLDVAINNYLSMYWNVNSSHTVCYYDNVWKREKTYCDDEIKNMQSMLGDIPMLVISPNFEDNDDDTCSICFKLNSWGVGKERLTQKFIPDNLTFKYRKESRYSKEERKQIIEELVPPLVCVIGYFIDNYYWNYYYEKPIMPSLLASGKLFNDNNLLETYRESYKQMCNLYLQGKISQKYNDQLACISDADQKQLSDVVSINNFNFPERSLELLDGIKDIVGDKEVKEMSLKVIDDFCEVRGIPKIRENNIEDFLQENRFTSQDIPFLEKLSVVFPEKATYINERMNMIEMVHTQSIKNQINISEKYGRKSTPYETINDINISKEDSTMNKNKYKL